MVTYFKCGVAFFFAFCWLDLTGQNLFEPISNSGEIPELLRSSSTTKSEQRLEELVLETNNEDYKSKKEFAQKGVFGLDRIMESGQVLYNDEISNYVQSVYGQICNHNGDVPTNLNIYVVRTPEANAFSFDQGTILVTTGLIAQLETEAQLAFFLCHEIAHYLKQHTIDQFLKSKGKLEDLTSRDIREYTAFMSKYSKSQEFEADEIGLKLYLNTPYMTDEAITAFDILHYSYLPFDENKFDFSILESDYFTVRDTFINKEIVPINVLNEDYDDSESSHPNVWKRKNKIHQQISSDKSESNDYFINPESEFITARDLSRKENIRIRLLTQDFTNAIYEAFLLLQDDPLDVFAETSIAKALYGLHQYKAFRSYNTVLEEYEEVEGESGRLHYFISQLTAEELVVLAAQKINEVIQKHPEDSYYSDLLADLIYDTVWEMDILYQDFHNSSKEDHAEDQVNKEELENKDMLDKTKSGKYRFIDVRKKSINADSLNSKHSREGKNGFVGIFEENHVARDYFKEISEKYLSGNRENNSVLSQDKEDIVKHGLSLGLSSAIFYNPNAIGYDKKGQFEYDKSDSQRYNYSMLIKKHASNQEKLDIHFLSFTDYSELTTKQYNQMSLLSAWLTEVNRHKKYGVIMIPLEGEYILKVEEFIEHPNLVITSVLSFKEARELNGAHWILSSLFYPVLPLTTSAALTKRINSYHYIAVYDLSKGIIFHSELRELKSKVTDKLLSGLAYDTVEQLTKTIN